MTEEGKQSDEIPESPVSVIRRLRRQRVLYFGNEGPGLLENGSDSEIPESPPVLVRQSGAEPSPLALPESYHVGQCRESEGNVASWVLHRFSCLERQICDAREAYFDQQARIARAERQSRKYHGQLQTMFGVIADLALPMAKPETDLCVICFDREDLAPKCFINCGHTYHVVCITKWYSAGNACPICRTEITSFTMHEEGDETERSFYHFHSDP